MPVLLSTYGGRGDFEPLVGWRCSCERSVRGCAAPDSAERPADWSGARQRELSTCPTGGSTGLETPVIRPASAVQRSTGASEVSQ